MTSADTQAMTALQELLDERQRYEGWLKVLDERRASTPPHVYDRVHTDYSLRLERVTERLSERAGQLSAAIDTLTGQLNTLRARESERTDARHEAELRAAVGEYGPDEWERMRDAADRELGEIGDQRRAVESEVAELERVVALTNRADEETRSGAEPVAEQEPSSAASAAPSASAASESQPTGPGSVASGESEAVPSGDVEAPSINDFVAEWPVKQAGEAGSGSESVPQGDGVPEVPEVDGGAAPAAAQVQPANSGNVAAFGLGSSTTPTRPVPPPAGDTRRESEKTLKCPECGVMNYATEWYCERCGGELSSF